VTQSIYLIRYEVDAYFNFAEVVVLAEEFLQELMEGWVITNNDYSDRAWVDCLILERILQEVW
jgi:hypothetical protein